MKSSRQLSKIFTIILHALSVLFAYFLLQGGSLIIQNLPRVDGEQVWQDYLDQAQLEQLKHEYEQLQASIEPFKDQLKLNRVESQGLSDVFSLDQKTYQEILASRYVSEDAGVNQKIEALRAKLEAQREGLKNLKQQRSQLELELNKLQQQQLSKGEAISDLKRQAREAFNEQRQGRNLKAFVLRLCFVLPLLLVAWYLLKNYRQTDYWPLVHGWSYFAGFAFFVELVPYLPSYGGYVRSLVGIVICIALGRVLTKKLRDYLQKRREIEQKDELERRNS
ncbi:MAG: hypothetical protein OIF35_12265, partial [Cellvibrionaceae bacterium]|nr:hypothetical protein [Cellvibrionaceae bacterium]